MKKKLLFGLFWFCCTWLYAQDIPSWQTYLEQLSDVEGIESGDLEEMYEMLSEQAAHPIDLNHATREDLAQLPFLTKQQIEELVEYIDQYAPLRSVGELAMIESLDFTRRKLLSYFVTINPSPTSAFPSMKDLLRYGRNELIATGKIPFIDAKEMTMATLATHTNTGCVTSCRVVRMAKWASLPRKMLANHGLQGATNGVTTTILSMRRLIS